MTYYLEVNKSVVELITLKPKQTVRNTVGRGNLKTITVMNYGISILFRAIPLLMALFCFGYGAFVLDMGTDTNRFVAGPVVFSLGMICIALFATAGTIIRQIIHTYSTAAKYALPIIGYLAAVVCFIGGMTYINDGSTVAHFVAGHVICGVAFSTAYVATTATSSTRFTFITQNSKKTDHAVPAKSFSSAQADILIILAVVFAVTTWVWAFWLLGQSDIHTAYYVAGHVMAGLACICTSLVALVATIVGRYVTLIVVPNGNGGPPSYW